MTVSKLAGVLLAGMVLASPVMAVEKTVYVDLDEVFSKFYKTQQADEQLREAAEEFRQERDELVENLKELRDKFDIAREDSQNNAFSETVRSERRNEAEELLIDLRDFESKIRQFDEAKKKQLDKQQLRMRNRIVEEIMKELEDYAVEKGIQAVIDSSAQSASGVDMVVFVTPNVDITQDIIDILNAGQQ